MKKEPRLPGYQKPRADCQKTCKWYNYRAAGGRVKGGKARPSRSIKQIFDLLKGQKSGVSVSKRLFRNADRGFRVAGSRGNKARKLHCLDFLVLLDNFRLGSLGEQGNDNDCDAGKHKSRQQLIDGEQTAQLGDAVLPDEDHPATNDHTGQCAPTGGAFPEQAEQNHGAKGGAEAGPGKGHDGEHGAFVSCPDHADNGNGDNGQAGDEHRSLITELDVEHILQEILGDAGGSGQKLRVGGGHRAGQNTGNDDTGENGEECALGGDELGDLHNDALALGRLGHCGQGAVLGDGVADDTDEDSDCHGDYHPDRGNTAGGFQLFGVFDGHEAQKDMGHTKVAETPGQCRSDGQRAVGGTAAGSDIIGGGEVQVAGKRLCIGDHIVPAAGIANAKEYNDNQSDGHNDGLHQVGEGSSQEAAERGIEDDNHSTDDHGPEVVHTEQAGEEGAAGVKAGGGIGDKEDNNYDGCNGVQKLLVLMESSGKEIRDGECADVLGVVAQTAGNDQPVDISTGSQTDGCPAGFGKTGQQCDTGKAHQEPGGHIGGLCTHSCDENAKLAAAEIEVIGFLISPGESNADADHDCHIQCNHDDHYNVVCHKKDSIPFFCAYLAHFFNNKETIP